MTMGKDSLFSECYNLNYFIWMHMEINVKLKSKSLDLLV